MTSCLREVFVAYACFCVFRDRAGVRWRASRNVECAPRTVPVAPGRFKSWNCLHIYIGFVMRWQCAGKILSKSCQIYRYNCLFIQLKKITTVGVLVSIVPVFFSGRCAGATRAPSRRPQRRLFRCSSPQRRRTRRRARHRSLCVFYRRS